MFFQLQDLDCGIWDSGPVFSAKDICVLSDRPTIHIRPEKLSIPKLDNLNLIGRPRLTELLSRSLSRSSAAIVSGRSGTGKTTLAVEYALKADEVGWFSLDSADYDWHIFSAHFAAAMTGTDAFQMAGFGDLVNWNEETGIESFLLSVCAEASNTDLIVLDDMNHIFDAPWFNTFFTLFIGSMPFRPHLLMTSRSSPAAPLWRMRSKQALEVIDEKLLAFNLSETEELFARFGVEPKLAADAHSSTFGRVSQILQTAEQYVPSLSPA